MRDLISREAALNCYHDWVDQYGDVHTPDEIPEYRAIEALPSAQPERKRGKWIDYANSHCECSVCHTKWSYFQNEVECFEFCPNCGADMREVDDERPD